MVPAQSAVKCDTQVFSCLVNRKGDVVDVINVIYWVSLVSNFENSAFVRVEFHFVTLLPMLKCVEVFL